jgi:hypothetical protein
MDELIQFLEFQIEMAKSWVKMYREDGGELWPDYETLIWGQRCVINAHSLTLSKIKRIKDTPTHN